MTNPEKHHPSESMPELDFSPGEAKNLDSTRIYLNGIGKVALLKAEREVELAKDIEAGVYAQHLLDEGDDERIAQYGRGVPNGRKNLSMMAREGERARDEMLEANLRLVVNLAKRYQGQGLEFLDLVQEGNLGLVRAVEKFDYAKGFKFSTYATWWIRQAVTRGVADQARTIRLPVHTVEKLKKVNRITRELTVELERAPTVDEIAQASGIEPDRVEYLQGLARKPVSLDMSVGEDDGGELGDFIADDDQSGAIEHEVELRDMISNLHEYLEQHLPPRELYILKMRYGIDTDRPHTLDEIGRMLNEPVTRERIRQILNVLEEKFRRDQKFRDQFEDYA